MRFTTASNMAEIDRATIDEFEIAESALMETAGSLTARHARNHFLSTDHHERVIVFCGKGHNGADGLVVGRWLDQWNYDVRVVLSSKLDDASPLTAQQSTSIEKKSNISMTVFEEGESLPAADLYVDALLGTGLSGNPRPPVDEIISRMNHSPAPIVSVDIPSGLNGDKNIPFDPTVRANLTVTFGLPKLGMVLEPGYTTTGKIVVQELGFPEEVYDKHAGSYHLISPQDIVDHLPKRHHTDHKGDSGRLAVLAGSKEYPGAAFLTARSASTTGAGLTALIAPDPVRDSQGEDEREIIFPHTLEEVLGDSDSSADVDEFLSTQDAVAIGPGLGQESSIRENLPGLLDRLTCPTVIDADGLNNFSGDPEKLSNCDEAVITPHPGEASRLLDKSLESVLKDPIDTARELHEITGHTVILKSSRPIIYHTNGSVSVNITGTPSLAKGGTGDVLTGIIAGLITQGLSCSEAACLGTYLHGAAGSLTEKDKPPVSVRPGDLIDNLPDAMQELRKGTVPGWYPIDFESNSPSVLRWNPLR